MKGLKIGWAIELYKDYIILAANAFKNGKWIPRLRSGGWYFGGERTYLCERSNQLTYFGLGFNSRRLHQH